MLAPNKHFQGLKAHYAAMTRGLHWETSYQAIDKVFPLAHVEGIKIHDWAKWEDPFRLTMEAYFKLQSEKEKKLYAVIEAFAQNNGHLGVSDARYINALKLFIQAVTPLEYCAHRGFAHLGRQLVGPSARIAAQMQSIDELRHFQNQSHTLSLFNRYFNGMHSSRQWFDHAWYLAAPKSFIEDACTAGPFEQMIALSFSYEYLFSNLLFVPFMSGAAHNGDISTVTFGLSAQSDATRHMTFGLECIKFLLEQDADNLPIVQHWLDKWFWRGYRLFTLVAMMQDYMLPKRSTSWKEAWEMYIESNGGAVFQELARYGVRLPKGWQDASEGKDHISHQAWFAFYQYSKTTALHTWLPNVEETAWLKEKYPGSFTKLYQPRAEHFKQLQQGGARFYNDTPPLLCTTCQSPMIFTEPGDPGRIAHRQSQYRDEPFNFCSAHCRDIFDHEPDKYLQASTPVHQIYREQGSRSAVLGNEATLAMGALLAASGLLEGQDNGDFEDSEDRKNFDDWRGDAIEGAQE
jgi:phenol/toluene 2-monooxygenase (NADH) P3/A3